MRVTFTARRCAKRGICSGCLSICPSVNENELGFRLGLRFVVVEVSFVTVTTIFRSVTERNDVVLLYS